MANNNLKFETVYNDNKGLVYNWIKRSINNSIVVEELTSDVFLQVHKHLHTFDSKKASLSTWLITIANRKMIDWFRKEKNKHKTTSLSEHTDDTGKEVIQIVSNSLTPEQEMENKRVGTAINLAINDLSPNYKEIAEMHFLNQFTYNEICEYLDIPLGTVKGKINRIREKLQTTLKENNIEVASY